MDNETEVLILNFILFVILPLWGLSGAFDWWCHKKSNIHMTSGLKESLIHAAMGAQIGVAFILGIFFELTVLTYLIMFIVLVVHEVIAHWDVRYSEPLRKITIWEMHAHNYLGTIPLYLFALITVLGWEIAVKTITFQWAGSFNFTLREVPIGGARYYVIYGIFITIVCVFPYISEVMRCLRYKKEVENAG